MMESFQLHISKKKLQYNERCPNLRVSTKQKEYLSENNCNI